MPELRDKIAKEFHRDFCDNWVMCYNMADFVLSEAGLEMLISQYECDIDIPGAVKVKEKK